MASNFFPRFSDVGLLRQFSFPLFYQFLLPCRDYLCEKHDLRWTDDPDTFPYYRLSKILAVSDTEMPDTLRSGVFYVDALSTSEGTRKLFEKLHYENLLPAFPLSRDDCALYTWLTAPGLTQEVHSCLASDGLQKAETLFGRRAAHPDLSRERLIAMEDDWNACFGYSNDKRHGIQVVQHISKRVVGFQLRHGELSQPNEIADCRGAIRRVVHRPERYDFLAYDPESGKLDVYSPDSWITGMYYVFLGKHLFNDVNFFANNENRCYTLDPLMERGRDALICSDIGGLERALLLELHTRRDGRKGSGSVFRSEKGLFEEWGSLSRLLHADETCIQASFLMQLTDRDDPQTLTICTPNATIFNRATGLSEVYERWLKRRTFARY